MNQFVKHVYKNYNRRINFISKKALERYFNKLSEIKKYELVLYTKNKELLDLILEENLRIKCYKKLCTYLDPYTLKTTVKMNKYIYWNDLQQLLLNVDSDDVKLEYLSEFENDYNKEFIIKSLKSDDNKLSTLLQLDFDITKISVIKSLKSEEKKIKGITYLSDDYNKFFILETIKDDTLLFDYYNNCPSKVKLDVVLCFNSDALKERVMNEFYISAQVRIIQSFKDEELIKKYCFDKKYSEYKHELISSIKNKEILISFFENAEDEQIKLKVLKNIKNQDLAFSLIKYISSNPTKEIIASNNEEYKNKLLESYAFDDIKYDVDQNISIGVELEMIGNLSEEFLSHEKFLVNWNIKRDGSLDNGVEITSPVLHFNHADMKELNFICDYFINNNFFTNFSCGGHIHLGFDYFNSKEQLSTFLNLYCNVEDILYLISNKAGTKIRSKIDRYARPTNVIFSDGSYLKINWDKIFSLKECTQIIKDKQIDKYYALNTKNIGTSYKNTLEFRMPNGEIEFNELIPNIKLFCKLLEKSKLISENGTDRLKYLYDKLTLEKLSQTDRLLILMNILFDSKEEKQLYIDRYYKNKEKSQELIKAIEYPIRL